VVEWELVVESLGLKFNPNQPVASQILNAKCNILTHLRGLLFDSGRDKSYNSICNFCSVFSEYGIQNERQISCTCSHPFSGSHQHVIVFCVVDI
jgi:hypothetical protein